MPNFIGEYFLIVLAVAALIGLYASPGPRGGTAGPARLLDGALPPDRGLHPRRAAGRDLHPFPAYLLRRDRRRGVCLLLSLAALGIFSVFYAWDTYDLPNLVAGMLGGSETGRAARPWRWR